MDHMGRWMRAAGRAAWRAVRAVGRGVGAAWPRMRALWDRWGYGASVLALVLLIGAAAYAYRSRPARVIAPPQTPAPEPAVLSNLALEVAAGADEAEEVPLFEPPLLGDVVGEYAADELAWSSTLEQWQTHVGVDIKAPLGAAVAASADGTVREVYRDALYGNVVVLQHDQGYETVYGGLQTLKMAEPGADVRRGEVIGAVGVTAEAEVMLGPHLHFEMWLDGKPMEPAIDWDGEGEDTGEDAEEAIEDAVAR